LTNPPEFDLGTPKWYCISAGELHAYKTDVGTLERSIDILRTDLERKKIEKEDAVSKMHVALKECQKLRAALREYEEKHKCSMLELERESGRHS